MNTRLINWHDVAMIGLIALIFHTLAVPVFHTIEGSK